MYVSASNPQARTHQQRGWHEQPRRYRADRAAQEEIRNSSNSGGAIFQRHELERQHESNFHRRTPKIAVTHSSIAANKRLRDQRQKQRQSGGYGPQVQERHDRYTPWRQRFAGKPQRPPDARAGQRDKHDEAIADRVNRLPALRLSARETASGGGPSGAASATGAWGLSGMRRAHQLPHPASVSTGDDPGRDTGEHADTINMKYSLPACSIIVLFASVQLQRRASIWGTTLWSREQFTLPN